MILVKNIIIYIPNKIPDSDGSDGCDAADDADHNNYSSIHAFSFFKLQGIHRIQSEIMTRNMFHN